MNNEYVEINDDFEIHPRCVICGDPIDYCSGHSPNDEDNVIKWDMHDDGDHRGCHQNTGCMPSYSWMTKESNNGN